MVVVVKSNAEPAAFEVDRYMVRVDGKGAEPGSYACTPADVHATVYQAMGIDHHTELYDQLDRPFQICDGQPLPLLWESFHLLGRISGFSFPVFSCRQNKSR